MIILVLSICLVAGYRAKIEWIDTYKERQTVSLWLLLMHEGKLERAGGLVDETACRNNGFDDLEKLQLYAKNGYFGSATISKMYIDDQGLSVASVKLPGNPEVEKLILKVDHDAGKFQIEEINLVNREADPLAEILNWFHK